jgi:hypothetical protein
VFFIEIIDEIVTLAPGVEPAEAGPGVRTRDDAPAADAEREVFQRSGRGQEERADHEAQLGSVF